MNWTIPTLGVIYTPCYNLKRTEMGCGWQGLLDHPTALISEAIAEPHLPSKEASRLRPALVAVKEKFSDRLAGDERVKCTTLIALVSS
ncbi:hypothetical protein AVEN_69937-1 [Araneus ventricosus]|uniref:Uncharacterized protein n=1 Tax=Araneus ventricosus TaxID=182803 RepID=A0A4Y2WBH8_ARAVE|nr:hypothetical protein AVEN_69937-1 [Araneus ventricosus]